MGKNASGSVSSSAGLTVTGEIAHSVVLSWTASNSPVSGYNAYRTSVSGGPYTLLNSRLISPTRYTDPTAQSGYFYCFVTTAVDSLGDESAYSDEAVSSVP